MIMKSINYECQWNEINKRPTKAAHRRGKPTRHQQIILHEDWFVIGWGGVIFFFSLINLLVSEGGSNPFLKEKWRGVLRNAKEDQPTLQLFSSFPQGPNPNGKGRASELRNCWNKISWLNLLLIGMSEMKLFVFFEFDGAANI